MSTSVEVWAPAFEGKNLPERLTVEAVFSSAEDYREPGKRWCNLCETWVPIGAADGHAKAHQRERETWRKGKRRAGARASKETLKEVNRLKRETKQIVGDRAPGDVRHETPSPGGRPSRSARKKESIMATTTTKKLSGRDAVVAAFRAAGKPLTASEVSAIVLDANLGIESKGATPVYYRLHNPIYREAKAGRYYRRVGTTIPAKFELRSDAPESDPKLVEKLKGHLDAAKKAPEVAAAAAKAWKAHADKLKPASKPEPAKPAAKAGEKKATTPKKRGDAKKKTAAAVA